MGSTDFAQLKMKFLSELVGTFAISFCASAAIVLGFLVPGLEQARHRCRAGRGDSPRGDRDDVAVPRRPLRGSVHQGLWETGNRSWSSAIRPDNDSRTHLWRVP